ncbi:hypothetical protein M3Y98_00374800 [Aphelenchoides besseyi]|nr:hypothetical protein M3Y98_00374800 [Aphelenchoides besseyi]
MLQIRFPNTKKPTRESNVRKCSNRIQICLVVCHDSEGGCRFWMFNKFVRYNTENMALIYASAVNKRMNAPRQKRSLAEGTNCMESSYTSHYRQRSNEENRSTLINHTNGIVDVSPARGGRKRSTSQHSQSNSSCACTPPPQSVTATVASHRDSSDSEKQRCSHQIHRSNTTAADMKRKIITHNGSNSRHVPRKSSTPVMAQSMYEPTYKRERQYSAKSNLRKTLAKKRLVQENATNTEEQKSHLADPDSSSDLTEDEDAALNSQPRRRSLSADIVRDERCRIQKQRGGSSKVSAFQKMCSRLQKWSFHSTAIKSQQN